MVDLGGKNQVDFEENAGFGENVVDLGEKTMWIWENVVDLGKTKTSGFRKKTRWIKENVLNCGENAMDLGKTMVIPG